MPKISLDLFKKHARTDDFADDDEYLLHLLKAATRAIVNNIYDARRGALVLEGGGGEPSLPQPVTHAVYMLAAHWYNQRESASTTQMHEVPGSIQALIKPYRCFVLPSDDEGSTGNDGIFKPLE